MECERAGLTPDECEELILAIGKTYQEGLPKIPEDNGDGFGFGDIFKNMPLIIGGLVVISLIGAVRK